MERESERSIIGRKFVGAFVRRLTDRSSPKRRPADQHGHTGRRRRRRVHESQRRRRVC